MLDLGVIKRRKSKTQDKKSNKNTSNFNKIGKRENGRDIL